MRQTLIALIWLYRFTLSPLIGNSCRHQPTCSENAIRKLHERGPLVGTWLSLKQILTCHPFHKPKKPNE
ncbi:MAG: membrane protein insertion efficiency factor YidD [Planctomycetota bacterium]